MTQENKIALFERMLRLEHMAEDAPMDRCSNIFQQVDGAYSMLRAVGLESEYIQWSIGK